MKYPELSDIDPDDPLADCQHVDGGFWGNHLRFMDGAPVISSETKLVEKMVGYRIWGHQPMTCRVKSGDVITVEYGSHWVSFLATDIKFESNPNDMFFGKCDLVRICLKETGEALYVRRSQNAVIQVTQTAIANIAGWVMSVLRLRGATQ